MNVIVLIAQRFSFISYLFTRMNLNYYKYK